MATKIAPTTTTPTTKKSTSSWSITARFTSARLLLATVFACVGILMTMINNLQISIDMATRVSYLQDDDESYVIMTMPWWKQQPANTTANTTNSSESFPMSTKDISQEKHTTSSLLLLTDSLKSYDKPSPIIDIISIGSINQLELQSAQKQTFGSHPSVRHFISATEQIDTEQDCYTNLTLHGMKSIVKYCRFKIRNKKKYQNDVIPEMYKRLTGNFASYSWLIQKPNPIGWMCAQKRPIDALMYTYKRYYNQSAIANNYNIPDYLWIIDDDTWINMDRVIEFLQQQQQQQYRSASAYAIAGCLIRSKLKIQNFTFPYGGYGLFLTKQTIQNMIYPINCTKYEKTCGTGQVTYQGIPNNKNNFDDFESAVCWRISQNLMGERNMFSNGMSVLDLMYSYVIDAPYLDARTTWGKLKKKVSANGNDTYALSKLGYCFHSDWLWGYFINYYFLAVHSNHPTFTDVLNDRLIGYNQSEIYAGKGQQFNPLGQCNYGTETDCTISAHICHRISARTMQELHRNTTNHLGNIS